MQQSRALLVHTGDRILSDLANYSTWTGNVVQHRAHDSVRSKAKIAVNSISLQERHKRLCGISPPDSMRSPRRSGRKSDMCGLMPSIVLEHRFRSKRPSECKHLLASWDAEPEDEFKDVHDPLSSCKEAITGPEADQ